MNRQEARQAKLNHFVKEYDIPIQDLDILNVALTHTSYANEHKGLEYPTNERLEFLGDTVLDLIIGEYLYLKYLDWSEGELTRAKASIVCESALADCAKRFEIGEYLLLGRGEEMTGGRQRASILADAFEALLGAIYLDNSYAEAKLFVIQHLHPYLQLVDSGNYTHDYKTELQEMLQKDGEVDIFYRLVREEGPDHDKTFYIAIEVNGTAIGQGMGKSKKDAAQQAARMGLKTLRGELEARS